MTIDRRRFVATLGAATALPAMTPEVLGAQVGAAETQAPHDRPRLCLLARELRVGLPDSGLDFWSRPFCDIAHAAHLPPEIARGTIWHERMEDAEMPGPEAVSAAFARHGFGSPQAPRRCAACSEDVLADTLMSFVRATGSHGQSRTAFVALDSLGPADEPRWADVLPAFRRCYDRIVGHFHLERRGLRHWKAWLDASFPEENGRSYFESYFSDAAAQCDAVVLTSPALIETDLHLGAGDPTEMLAGELIGRLGYALLNGDVIAHIAGPANSGPMRKPRLFALGSLTWEAPFDYMWQFWWLLHRQERIAEGAFGEPPAGEKPLFVVTASENMSDEHIADMLSEESARVLKLPQPTYIPEPMYVPLDADDYPRPRLHVATLWPVEFNQ
jgi:hypothetical protein